MSPNLIKALLLLTYQANLLIYQVSTEDWESDKTIKEIKLSCKDVLKQLKNDTEGE